MNKAECIIFITVRLASKRLPEKALLEINGKPIIKILIDRIANLKKINKIVVCTTTEKSDNKLVKYLQNHNIEVFRGENEDILDRLYHAAEKYNANQFVVVEGDDFFCDLSLIEKTCKKIQENNFEFIVWENLPFGVSPLGIKTSKLKKLIEKKMVKNTETGWGKLIIESKLFKVGRLEPTNKKLMRPEIRLTVDYPEDFELAKKIYNKISTNFKLIDIIRVLDKNPSLLKINESVKSQYMENFDKEYHKSKIRKEYKN